MELTVPTGMQVYLSIYLQDATAAEQDMTRKWTNAVFTTESHDLRSRAAAVAAAAAGMRCARSHAYRSCGAHRATASYIVVELIESG